MHSLRLGLARTLPVLGALVALSACSSQPGDGGTVLEHDGGNGTTPPDNPGLGGDDGGAVLDTDFAIDSNAPTTTDPGDAACAATHAAAQQLPLDLFIMQDQSGSMKDTTSTGVTKWQAVQSALQQFMSYPSSAGIGVGIQYFGLKAAGGGGGGGGGISASSCNVADYAKAEVEIAALPGVQAAITASFAAHSPSTDTPTGPALEGAIQHAQAWKKAHPDHVVVVVLATDGMPTACTPKDIPGIAAQAKTASAGTPAIQTYVIGVLAPADISQGADTNLNTISTSGNGSPAFIIQSGTTDVAKAFVTALTKIRGAALGCEYQVPTGTSVDYSKVNVELTLAGTPATLGYVGSAAACKPGTGGWYYDVAPTAGTPTKIELCPSTCTSLAGNATAKLDIAVGCQTQLGPM